ncbi:MAG TPA: short chain dehydrogenase [Dissulfurispiraceae bacterium]|nr:short chain dehydrogenase [Dissulfurispiraceae bacterium]
MKVLLIGATGTIGSAIMQSIGVRHEVVQVSRSKTDIRVDLSDKLSITNMFKSAGRVDAVICAAGLAVFGPLLNLSDDDFALGIGNKLMGQVNVVRVGVDYLKDSGSFTLTSGILSRKPTQGSVAISLVNSGLEGFCRAAALEMPRGIRINVVSPNWVIDTLKAFKMDPSIGTPVEAVAHVYVEALEGGMTGQVLDAIR